MAITAENIIVNIGNQTGPIVDLIMAVAYLIGVVLITGALFKLRRLSDHQRGMFQPHEALSPFVYLIVGAGLIYLPKMFEIATDSVFTNNDMVNLLGYAASSGDNTTSKVMDSLQKVLAVIGLAAFVRGLSMMASASGGHQGQGGGYGKALTHMLGGVLCYHIGTVYQIVLETLGLAT